MEQSQFIRHTAVKVHIQTLLTGTFMQENEQNQNYFCTAQNEKLYRISIIGTIIHKEKIGSITNFLLDDGSGNIVARFFEERTYIHSLDVGNTVIIVGKVRMYNNEKYISPEICTKINPVWLKIRKKELNTIPQVQDKQQETEEELIEQEQNETETLPFQKMITLIKELDKGEGVLIENIIEKSSLEDTGKILDKMLEKGDIFQNVPGKVKVL